MRDGWWILLGIGVLVWLFFGRKTTQKPSTRPKQQSIYTLADITPGPPPSTRSRKPATPVHWLAPGESTRIHDLDLPGGMIYIGSVPRSSYDRRYAHVIDPAAKVDSGRADIGGQTMSYWPSYGAITPAARRGYLQWLAGGRRDPAAGIGHVFLFFYGLEHRLFVDGALDDALTIVNEVQGLLEVYGEQSSFRSYANRFIDAVQILVGAIPDAPPTELTPRSYEIPLPFRCALARRLTQGRLTADWLLAWCVAHPETNLKTPATRCFDELRQIFQLRFDREYPQGLAVRIPTKKLQLTYQPATGGGPITLGGPHCDWPDPAALTAPLKVGNALITACTEALNSYSRFLGRNPGKRGTLAAHSLLPPELRGTSMPTFDAIRSRLEAMTPGGVGETTIGGLLAELQITDVNRKPSAADLGLLSTGLQSLGFAMEPDPRFGGKVTGITTSVLLFRARDGATVDPTRPAYVAARMLVEIAAVAATIDAENVVPGLSRVQAEIARLTNLTDDERLRLLAYLASFRRTGPNPKLALQKLAALPAQQRERIARVGLGALVADRRVGADEVAFAERLYRALGLPANQLYADLHSASGTELTRSDELPRVATADPPRGGTAVPPPPVPTRTVPPQRSAPARSSIALDPQQLADARRKAATVREQFDHARRWPAPGSIDDPPYILPQAPAVPSITAPAPPPPLPSTSVVIDVTALARKRQETDAVRLLLTDVFADDEEETIAVTDLADDAPIAGPTTDTSTARYAGLDEDHAAVVDLIIAKHGRIAKAELEAAISARGLFFDGTLESINDWAFGRFGEPLIEEGDPCVVPSHLMSQLHQFA